MVKIGAVEDSTTKKKKKSTDIICVECGEVVDRNDANPDHKDGFICLHCNRFFPGLDFEGDWCEECTTKEREKQKVKESKKNIEKNELETSLSEAAYTFDYIRHRLKANTDHEVIGLIDVLSKIPVDGIGYLIKAAKSKFKRDLPPCPSCGKRIINVKRDKSGWIGECSVEGTGPISNWNPSPAWVIIIWVEEFLAELSNVPNRVKEIMNQ